MQQKAKKTISHVTPVRPLTNEEKKERVIRFLAQKREQYAISILQGIVANPEAFNYGMVEEKVIDHAVSLADKLLEKLYPLTDGGASDGE